MKKRLLYLVLPLVTLILEILPYGAVCNFMLPAATEGVPAGRFRELYSYFDLTPFGYANFAPLITAVLGCVVLLILAGYCITGKEPLARAAKNLVGLCAVISFGPLLLGVQYLSVVGVLISLSLVAEFVLLHALVKSLAPIK